MSDATRAPALSQLNLVVRDMSAALAFWRRLGLEIKLAPAGVHASASLPGGLLIEWDTAESAARWDSGTRGVTGGGAVIGFEVPTRQAVDEMYADLIAAGYRGHQRPYDAFWGARYAIIDDPDGHPVGLMSPTEQERAVWPPRPAPAT